MNKPAKPAIQMPVSAGPKPDLTPEAQQATSELINTHTDKPEATKRVGRPSTGDANDARLQGITCKQILADQIAVLAKEWDRSEAYVIRKLLEKGAAAAIINESLEHKLNH